jgi:hypothetical protein
MKTTPDPWRKLAMLAFAALLGAGCAATPGLDEQAGAGDAATGARQSPAGERVIGGVAEMVLTSQPWAGFEEARNNPITTLQDGSPLYAYIRATRSLGELAHPPDPGGSYSFSDYPHLFLQVGDTESLRILGTCYITLTEEEARARELVVPLAPLTYRPGQIPADCWLATAASGRSGQRTYEVRLAGFAGKFESWLPVPDLLAVAAVPTDFSSGAAGYAAMLKATPLRHAAPAANSPAATPTVVNSAPVPMAIATPIAVATPIRGASLVAIETAPLPGPRQDIGNSRMELQLQTLSAALLGRPPSEAYFMDKQWSSTTDQRGRVVQQHAHAAAIFKGASCSWLRLRAFRRPGAPNLVDVEQAGEPIEINCTDLQ